MKARRATFWRMLVISLGAALRSKRGPSRRQRRRRDHESRFTKSDDVGRSTSADFRPRRP